MTTVLCLRRATAALAASTLLALTPGCAADDSREEKSTTSPETREEAEEAAPDIPLSETLGTPNDAPSWTLPEPKGWSAPEDVQEGLRQISEEGGDATLAFYSQLQPPVEDTQGAGRDWLSEYYSAIVDFPDATEVSDPTYETTLVPTTAGTAEFDSVDFTYKDQDGRLQRSFAVGRYVGDRVVVAMYNAPADDWSEDTWRMFIETGLELQV